jgi:chromosomal replication initiator protein
MSADRTLESFVRDTASASACAAATGLARRAPGSPHLLLLCGPPGVGKTHLLAAILDDTRSRFPSAVTVETSAAELVNRLLAALPDRTGASLPYWAADLLVVDDLHVLAGKPATQAEVGRRLKAMVERGARVACASGGPASRIPVLADVVRGMPGARLIEMHPATRGVMRRILARNAAAAGIGLTGANLSSVVDRGEGDVRRALGALNRLRLEVTCGRSRAPVPS